MAEPTAIAMNENGSWDKARLGQRLTALNAEGEAVEAVVVPVNLSETMIETGAEAWCDARDEEMVAYRKKLDATGLPNAKTGWSFPGTLPAVWRAMIAAANG